MNKKKTNDFLKFLKPDLRTIVITLIITGLSFYYISDCFWSEPRQDPGVTYCNGHGLPFTYLREYMSHTGYAFNLTIGLNAGADLIVWYVVLSAIRYIYNKPKNRKKL